MRDLHCHILPGVDDGSPDLQSSLRMLEAARAAGVTSMVCTPHINAFYADYQRERAAFATFYEVAAKVAPQVHVSLGFEVAHSELLQLGIDEWAPRLRFAETPEFLLELDAECIAADFRTYERTVYELQGLGLSVIIAHPERYRAVQKDIQLARNLVDWGCELQLSANFMARGPLSQTHRCARRLLREGLVAHIASDAHRPEHYKQLQQALRAWR